MRRQLMLVATVGALGISACEDTPFGNVQSVEGTYLAEWILSWDTNNPDVSPPGFTGRCSGSVTLGDQRNDTFSGIFLINADQDCFQGSPVSGNIVDGRIRADGGINFTMQVQPTQGEVKEEDDIWEDIFAGSAIILPQLILGCEIENADNQMVGALFNGQLFGSMSAGLSCPPGSQDVQLQVRVEANR